MVFLQEATLQQLTALLNADELYKLNEFDVPQDEAIAPNFLLELAINQLSQDPINRFWWAPWLIAFDMQIVGMIGFKSPPTLGGVVEIGYGIVPSQWTRGFATQAVQLLLKDAFSRTEVQLVVAHTAPLNRASQRVLEKNGFGRNGSKVDPADGEVWIWQKTRTMNECGSIN